MGSEQIAESKRVLRAEARVRRDALAVEQRAAASAAICRHVAALVPPGSLMAFVAMGSEVDLSGLGPDVLPRVEGDRLVPVRCSGGADLVRSRFGVLEPVGPGVDPAEIDVVCVPGLAFDRRGYRVGYGKGFYDRFLPLLRPDTVVIGVCFDVQLVNEVPHDHFDVPVPRVVTESGLVQ